MPLPSKGILLQYNDDLAALDADPDWTTLGCILRVGSLGGLRVETAEHRCLDQSDDFVTKYPTGFKTSDDAQLSISYTGAKYKVLRDKVNEADAVEWLWRLTFPKERIAGVLQSVAATEKWKAFLTSAMLNFPDDGSEISIEVTLSPNSKATFTEGTPGP